MELIILYYLHDESDMSIGPFSQTCSSPDLSVLAFSATQQMPRRYSNLVRRGGHMRVPEKAQKGRLFEYSIYI